MAAITYFHATKCCHLVSENKASADDYIAVSASSWSTVHSYSGTLYDVDCNCRTFLFSWRLVKTQALGSFCWMAVKMSLQQSDHSMLNILMSFYCTMHYSAKHGLAIACRLSVCSSVTLVDQNHISWKTWKLIAWTISPTPPLSS